MTGDDRAAQGTFQGVSSKLALPVETIEIITRNALGDTSSTTEREQLYETMKAAHPLLHHIVLHELCRFPLIDCSRLSEEQDLYNKLVAECAALAGVHIDHNNKNAFLQSLFRASHVHLLVGSASDAFGVQRLLEQTILNSTAITIDAGSDRLDQTVPTILIPVITKHPALTRIYLDCTWGDGAYRGLPMRDWDKSSASSVTSLRLRSYPPCACGKSRVEEQGHDATCLYTHLLHFFPNLRHLHIGHPIFLKELDPPHTLETLVLEAPLARYTYIACREPYSSLIGFNIASALKRGFMRWPSATGGAQKRIIVRTGEQVPYGWAAAQAACNRFGVGLKKVVVYTMPVQFHLPAGKVIEYVPQPNICH
ncbi:hypothetical protein C8Q74DRAFT_1365122 [Fomes fomentarius]|nr:hypothetical protein C8Q74DRAFT_1365122 [Fomes fomentarius]